MTEENKTRVEKVKRVKTVKKRKRKSNKNIILAIVILLLIVVFAGVFFYGSQLEKQRSAELQDAEVAVTDDVIYGDTTLGIDPIADERLQGYRNILFLGTDAPDEDGSSRTDGIVIISINKETKDIKIFSIARDTYMEVEPGSDEKITHAHMHAGMDQTLWALNHNLDLNIREVVSFDWEAVANVVDRTGGVQVELTDRELEFLNPMLAYDNQVPGSGIQELNGEQAVAYSRMRKDVETLSDFRRNERLKIVLTQALQNAQAMELEDRIVFAEQTLDDVITNIQPDKIVEMAQEASQYNIVKSDETFPFEFKGNTTDRTGRVFVPITLESNVAELYEEYFGITDYNASETVKTISERFIEETGIGSSNE